jgi:hypothetical protein
MFGSSVSFILYKDEPDFKKYDLNIFLKAISICRADLLDVGKLFSIIKTKLITILY